MLSACSGLRCLLTPLASSLRGQASPRLRLGRSGLAGLAAEPYSRRTLVVVVVLLCAAGCGEAKPSAPTAADTDAAGIAADTATASTDTAGSGDGAIVEPAAAACLKATDWTNELVYNDKATGLHHAIAAGPGGTLHVSFNRTTGLAHAERTADGWKTTSLLPDVYTNDIFVDADGNPHVFNQGYHKNSAVAYLWREGGVWHEQVAAKASYLSVAVAMGPDGAPHVMYNANGSSSLPGVVHATKAVGEWKLDVIDPDVQVGAVSLDIAVDSHGALHATYSPNPQNMLRYATGKPGAWTVHDFTPKQGRHPRIAFAQGGAPAVLYLSGSHYYGAVVNLATRTGSGWTHEVVDGGWRSLPGGRVARVQLRATELTSDASGTLHAAWTRDNRLTYARRRPGQIYWERIELKQPVYRDIGVAVSPQGAVHLLVSQTSPKGASAGRELRHLFAAGCAAHR